MQETEIEDVPEPTIECNQTGETFESMEAFNEHKERLMYDAALDATAERLENALGVTAEEVEEALDDDFESIVESALTRHNEFSSGVALDNIVDADKEMVAGTVLKFVGFKMLNKNVCDE